MTHVYHLDVDLLGGLQVLATKPGPHFIELDIESQSEIVLSTMELQSLRTNLLEEAKSFLQLEIDVASRKADAYEGEGPAKRTDEASAFELDAAARARREVSLYQNRLVALESVVDEVLDVFQIVPAKSASQRAEGIYVRLHWDGYAREENREQQLSSRREHLGLPPNKDWTAHDNS